MDIFNFLWTDTASKLFTITFTCYLFGYMIYGGYIYTFFGRKGNLPFGLADFSIADLISILPTAIITLFNIIPKILVNFLKEIGFHLALPLIVGVSIRIGFASWITLFYSQYPWAGFIIQAGIIVWFLGYMFTAFQSRKILRIVLNFVEVIGAIILISAIPNVGQAIPKTPPPFDLIQPILSLLSVIPFTVVFFTLPYLFGIQIAEKAIKLNLLMKIDRLTLRQPILIDGMRKIAGPVEIKNKNSLQELWLTQKNLPIDIAPDAYEWLAVQNKNTYLIATFEKFVILFVLGTDAESNQTIMVNRDDILSIEITNKTESKTVIKNGHKST